MFNLNGNLFVTAVSELREPPEAQFLSTVWIVFLVLLPALVVSYYLVKSAGAQIFLRCTIGCVIFAVGTITFQTWVYYEDTYDNFNFSATSDYHKLNNPSNKHYLRSYTPHTYDFRDFVLSSFNTGSVNSTVEREGCYTVLGNGGSLSPGVALVLVKDEVRILAKVDSNGHTATEVEYVVPSREGGFTDRRVGLITADLTNYKNCETVTVDF